VITDVTLRLPALLRRAALPGAARGARGRRGSFAADVLQAVMRIRRERLPDPAVLPNVGSFFKNPVIDARASSVCAPGIRRGALGGRRCREARGAWLVEQAGGKGMREGRRGCTSARRSCWSTRAVPPRRKCWGCRAHRHGVRERFGIDLEIEPAVY